MINKNSLFIVLFAGLMAPGKTFAMFSTPQFVEETKKSFTDFVERLKSTEARQKKETPEEAASAPVDEEEFGSDNELAETAYALKAILARKAYLESTASARRSLRRAAEATKKAQEAALKDKMENGPKIFSRNLQKAWGDDIQARECSLDSDYSDVTTQTIFYASSESELNHLIATVKKTDSPHIIVVPRRVILGLCSQRKTLELPSHWNLIVWGDELRVGSFNPGWYRPIFSNPSKIILVMHNSLNITLAEKGSLLGGNVFGCTSDEERLGQIIEFLKS